MEKMENTMTSGKTMRVKKEEGRGDIVLFRAYKMFRGEVLYDSVSNSLSIFFDVDESLDFDSYGGQCKDGKGMMHAVTKETCYFNTFLQYKKCDGTPKPENLPKANKFCSGVDGSLINDCVRDCMITGVDFSGPYRREVKHENDELVDFSN